MTRRSNHSLELDETSDAIVMVMTAISGLMTYQGLNVAIAVSEAGWLSHVVAAALAFAVTLVIYLFWRNAFRAIGLYRRGPPIGLGMCITIAVLPLIIGISSWYNVTGISGRSALDHHLTHSLLGFERAADEHYAASLVLERFAAPLALAAASYQAEAVSECTDGGRTGSGGEGTMCFTLRAVAGQMTELADISLPALIAETRATGTQARALLDEMRLVANSEVAPEAKMTEVARLADQLRAVLAGLDAGKALTLIQSGVDVLPGETAKRALSAKGKAGRARQQAALDALRAELEAFAADIAAAIADLPDADPAPVPSLDRLNAATAVFRYAEHYIPFWIAGIALDLMPLALLLFLVVQRSTLSEEEWHAERVLSRTLRDQLEDEIVRQIGRAPVTDPKSIKQVLDHAKRKRIGVAQEVEAEAEGGSVDNRGSGTEGGGDV